MRRFRLVMKWLLGLGFMTAGIYHFVNPQFYVRIMPPYLPWHLELVYLSGLFEMILGALVLVPRFTGPAAWGLVALLIAVFPANLHMAFNAEIYPNLSPAVLWARLPIQGLLIAAVYRLTRPNKPTVPPLAA